MNKPAPRVPVLLLLILAVLIAGILLAAKMNGSKDKGTFKRVQNVREAEKELYEITPGGKQESVVK